MPRLTPQEKAVLKKLLDGATEDAEQFEDVLDFEHDDVLQIVESIRKKLGVT